MNDATTRNLAALLAQFAHLQRDERVSYVFSADVRYRYQLLQDVFVVVVTTTASNVFADRDVIQAVVCIPSERFGCISDDVVDDNVFDATDVLTDFCNDGSSDVLTEGEKDAFLVTESREEFFLDDLGRKDDVNDVARPRAVELEHALKETTPFHRIVMDGDALMATYMVDHVDGIAPDLLEEVGHVLLVQTVTTEA